MKSATSARTTKAPGGVKVLTRYLPVFGPWVS
jgi:hypothetical protein